MRVSARAQAIEPFFVMEIAKAAMAIAATQSSVGEMIHLNIGEPDFKAAPLVEKAAQEAISLGLTQYTHASGTHELREAISNWYLNRWGLHIEPARITVTAGASAALLLSSLALIEAGDEILMPDPSYACNRHFVSVAQGVPTLLPTNALSKFQLSANQIEAHWQPKTRGVMLASPSNPTGTCIDFEELKRIHKIVKARSGITLVDEIYLGLAFGEQEAQSALAIDDEIISINSFSKYFNMTGWRLGWLVTPLALAPTIERLAQNLFICPSSIAQHAALACFEPSSLRLFEERKAAFKARRDYLVPELKALGFEVPVTPDGAFYCWADCRPLYTRFGVSNSWDFTMKLMHECRIALAPGRDFGEHEVEHYVRISIASSMQDLEQANARMKQLWSHT
jgi:aspartate/methionine/tyrosine aminotransferase